MVRRTPVSSLVAIALALIASGGLALALALPPQAGARTQAHNPRITFYFGLKRPESRARRAYRLVTSPGKERYRRFLTRAQAARRLGARPKTIRRFRRAARRHGFRVRVDRSRVFARVTGSKRRFQRAFGRRIGSSFNNDVNATGYFVVGKRAIRLPGGMRRAVRKGELVTSFSRSIRRRGDRAALPAASKPQPGNDGTWTGGCEAARHTGGYSYGQVRNAYGIDAVGSTGGGSIAIMNAGEGLKDRDIKGFDRCFGHGNPKTRTLLADGQSQPFGRGSFEPQEDYDLARGMAPGLKSVTFAQTWLAPELWFLSAAEVLDRLRRLPDTFSISYGQCEKLVRGKRAPRASRAGANLLDALLMRLGIEGVGSFASAGDFGSTCDGRPFRGVTWPASSPFVTSVGGTRLILNAANQRAGEVVWNDLRWLPSGNGGGAGGGGFSAVSARPSYQRGLAIPGNHRTVPDISAHASMLPGWPVMLAGNWVEDGGTSASAPLTAGAFAAMSAGQRAIGNSPLGPVNGLLYNLESSDPATAFDVVSGENGYSHRVPGFKAGPGYDLASGLGVPRFDHIAVALPPEAGLSDRPASTVHGQPGNRDRAAH